MYPDPSVTHAYLGYCKSGHLILLQTDFRNRETAKEIGKIIRGGGTIKHVTIDKARASASGFGKCDRPGEGEAAQMTDQPIAFLTHWAADFVRRFYEANADALAEVPTVSVHEREDGCLVVRLGDLVFKPGWRP